MSVTVTSANPSNGVTISNIINSGGNITANIAASCTATDASFTLQASDGASTTTATLSVSVTANTAPTLSYQNQAVNLGNSLTINPATVPSDNGSISTIAVQSKGTYTGTISVNSTTGVVSISNAQPAGTHTIVIRATDNCGQTTDAAFDLVVNIEASLSINDVSLTEGDSGTKSFVFTVTLSQASNLVVTVDYQTANGTASTPSDYQSTSGTLTFNPGDLTKTITVLINGDTTNEGAETFFVNLSSAVNATTSDDQGKGTIKNDDATQLQFSISNYTVGEADGHATITRGQALRELVDSPEISQRFFNKAFVVVGYFAYLRRDPDALYLDWIAKLNNPPAGQTFEDTYREMIRGFIESQEYRHRFGG